jgi:hypothetical protein
VIIIPIPMSTGIGTRGYSRRSIPDEAVKDLKAGDWFVTITYDDMSTFPWWTRIYRMEHDGVAPLWFQYKGTAAPSSTRWGARRQMRKLLKTWTEPVKIEVYKA